MNAPIKLLLDVHIWEGLTVVLGERGYDVLHINHTPYRELEDEDVLAFASEEGRAVLTCNHKDFVPIARIWYEAGREHANNEVSIILSVKLSRTNYLHQTSKFLQSLSAPQIHNTIRWLQEFK